MTFEFKIQRHYDFFAAGGIKYSLETSIIAAPGCRHIDGC